VDGIFPDAMDGGVVAVAVEAESKKVVVVTNIPNPYRVPFFNAVAQILAESGLTLHVIFAARTYPRRMFKLDEKELRFSHEFLQSRYKLSLDGQNCIFYYSGLMFRLRRLKPEAVVVAGFSPGTIKTWLLSVFKDFSFFIWTGSVPWQVSGESKLRRLQRRILLSRTSGCIAYSASTKEYLKGLGVADDHIHVALNTVDTDFFREQVNKIREKSKTQIIEGNFLCISYLIPRKQVGLILQAVAILAGKRNDFHLDIVGDGPQRAELERYSMGKGLSQMVTFHGFKQKEELPEFLARASCLLFPTRFDVWGLVLNEAMASGLPCLASINAGATRDLVQEGETGFVVDFTHIRKVAEWMEWILNHPRHIQEMGEKARCLIQEKASLEQSAASFCRPLIAK